MYVYGLQETTCWGCIQVLAYENKPHHFIRDVQWLGKLWHQFYSIPSTHSADKYVDTFDDYIDETGTNQEVEDNVQEIEQMPATAEHTSIGENETIAARTRSHDK